MAKGAEALIQGAEGEKPGLPHSAVHSRIPGVVIYENLQVKMVFEVDPCPQWELCWDYCCSSLSHSVWNLLPGRTSWRAHLKIHVGVLQCC